MKKSILMMGAALCAAALQAQTAVLYTGSEWTDRDAALKAQWLDPAFAGAAGVNLEVLDTPTVPHKEPDPAIKEKQNRFGMDIRAIPAFAWFDAQGRCVMFRQRLDAMDAATAKKTLEGLLKEGRARDKKFQQLLASDSADGAGELLSILKAEIGLNKARDKKNFKAAWDMLKAKDPQDASGWDFALTFNPIEATYKVQDFEGKKDFEGGEKHLADLEAKVKTHLTLEQKQGLALLHFVLHRNRPEKADAMNALLRDVVKMGPNTHFGVGAQGKLCMRAAGPVGAPYGWYPAHVKGPGEQTWDITLGVGKTLQQAGRYAIKINRDRSSKGKMRILAFEVNGENVGASEVEPNKGIELPFTWDGGELPKISLKVAFDAPGDKERGRITFRPLLPLRLIRKGDAIDRKAEPWKPAPKKKDSAVAAYARTVLPEETLREIQGLPGGTKFLKAFFSNKTWMEDFFASGMPIRDWSVAIKGLDTICYYIPEVLKDAKLRRWATAAALNADADPTEIVRILKVVLQNRAEKRLVKGVDSLRVDQLRFLMVPEQCEAEGLRHLAIEHNGAPHTYGGACWACPYRLRSFFGDSIHGADYYAPWEHTYFRQYMNREVGGVCGSLSHYGSNVAKAHGVPSVTGGQPAHCAYMLWSEAEQRWMLAYNVGAYTGNHFCMWQRHWHYSAIELGADVFARKGLRESFRALWKVEASLAKRPDKEKPHCDPKYVEAYFKAAAKCPGNYELWRRFGDWLKSCSDVSAETWTRYAEGLAKGVGGHLEPVWEMIEQTAAPAIEKLAGKEEGKAAVKKLYVKIHGILRQGDWKTAEFCNYEAILNNQAKRLGDDPAACFALFEADLVTQAGTADAFGRLMRWGGARFLKNDIFAKKYVAAIEKLLKTNGNEGNVLGKYVRESIRESAQAGNTGAFQSLCTLQDALTPPKDRKPLEKEFAFAKMPLLSDKGLLRISTTSNWDHPEAYGHVIDGLTPPGDSFHTSNETSPWAEVLLPGMAEVSEVYLRNRNSNANRLPPFILEVSEDGKTWTEVGRDTQIKAEYTFTFPAVKAQHIRVRCTPNGKTYLHLSKFCVFGKKLY